MKFLPFLTLLALTGCFTENPAARMEAEDAAAPPSDSVKADGTQEEVDSDLPEDDAEIQEDDGGVPEEDAETPEDDAEPPTPDAEPPSTAPPIMVTVTMIDPGSRNPLFNAVAQYLLPDEQGRPLEPFKGLDYPTGSWCMSYLGSSRSEDPGQNGGCQNTDLPRYGGPDVGLQMQRGVAVPNPEHFEGNPRLEPSPEYRSSYTQVLHHDPALGANGMGTMPNGQIRIAVLTKLEAGVDRVFYPLPRVEVTVRCGEHTETMDLRDFPEEDAEDAVETNLEEFPEQLMRVVTIDYRETGCLLHREGYLEALDVPSN